MESRARRLSAARQNPIQKSFQLISTQNLPFGLCNKKKKTPLVIEHAFDLFYAFLVQNKTLLLQFKKFTRNSDDYARNLKWSKLEGFEFGQTKPNPDQTFYFGIWFGFGSG